MTVLLVALALDLTLGEPPNRWHPVAWIGRLLGHGARLAPQGPPWLLLLHGTLLVLLVAGAAAAGAWLVTGWASPWPLLRMLVAAWLLKCAFSVRRLFGSVREVQQALARGDLDGARRALGLHLVSRPTGDLDEGAVASAAVESLAENLTDSLTGPLVAYAVGGLPTAVAYRMVNTADAMLGYRSERYEHLGKAAARLDDVANLLPARVAALALVAASAVSGYSPTEAWRGAWQGRRATASPNAGWTIGAMAGALGVVLEKVGHYRLGVAKRPVTPAVIREAATLVGRAAALLSVSILLLEAWRSARNRQS